MFSSGTFTYLQTAPIPFVMSVRVYARISAAPTSRISLKFFTEGYYENLSRKSKFA